MHLQSPNSGSELFPFKPAGGHRPLSHAHGVPAHPRGTLGHRPLSRAARPGEVNAGHPCHASSPRTPMPVCSCWAGLRTHRPWEHLPDVPSNGWCLVSVARLRRQHVAQCTSRPPPSSAVSGTISRSRRRALLSLCFARLRK